jgi:polyhydroxybutyrate depolymerase
VPIVLAVLGLAVAPCGPRPPAGHDPALAYGSMATSDGERAYWVFTPPHPRALVVALHALNWTAEDFAAYTGFDRVAATDGFVVVYPQGLNKAWNAGYCCPAFHTAAVDDGAFLSSLIATFTQPGWKVFLLGFSNGAMMAYSLACQIPHSIAALGVVGSDGEACSPAAPLPAILHFQGTSDTVTGNRAWARVGEGWVKEPVTATTWWAHLGADVRLVRVQNGIHDWYRHDPDASALIGAFFAQHL